MMIQPKKAIHPWKLRSNIRFKVQHDLDKLNTEHFQSSSPAPFIGRYGYPDVNVGILSPVTIEREVEEHDDPRRWGRENYQIPNIMELRSSLLNTRKNINVRNAFQNKFVEAAQLSAMTDKHVDVEVKLEKKPNYVVQYSKVAAPMGPNANVESIDITSNPFVSSKVEKVVADKELRAAEGISYLYTKGFDENHLTGMLSTGTMGLGVNRKLVPTRWSITAVDDMLGKDLIKHVKDYNPTDYLAFFGSYLGNNFLVMCFPEVWSYELFENYIPSYDEAKKELYQYTTDHESYAGRKDYADETVGGYYAARLAILEKLAEMKRQASVLVLRFITSDYYNPLGVWVVREAVRRAMNEKPIEFASRELMLTYAKHFARKRFGFDADVNMKRSFLLKLLGTQRKLREF